MQKRQIRYDQKGTEDKKEIYQMYQDIFQDPKEFTQYYFQEVYENNRVLMLMQDEKLASMIHLNPYDLVIRGKEEKASYIVAVATWGKFRRQGMMAELLKRAFSDLAGEGQMLTYLIPADPAYYEPFDFTFVMDWNETTIEEKKKEEKGELSYKIRPVGKEDEKKAALFLNKKRQEQYSLWVKADESYIRKQQKEMESEEGGLFFIEKEGQEEGIFFCTREEKMLSVTNLWLPEEMKEEEWRRLFYDYFHKEKMEVVWGAKKPETIPAKKVPTIMVRILCLEKLLELIGTKKEATIVLSAADHLLPHNNGCFLWQAKREGSSIERTKKKPDWTVSIAALTRILFRYGDWKEELEKAPMKVKSFFENLDGLEDISITEQV